MSSYVEGILTLLLINATAAMGVSLLTGFTGIFTLGHAAYLALGAYTTAILVMEHAWHWLPAIFAGGVVAMLVAWIIGIPTLKLFGDYYAIASIGLAESIKLILANWESVTRGARGYPDIAGFMKLPEATAVFVVLALAIFFLLRSNYGRAFKACRDDHTAAALLGFDTAQVRVLSLVISAFYCGVAGGMFAGFFQYLKPDMFDMMKSTELTAVVVFGGMGSMSGCILGTVILTLITELFRAISLYRMLIYGAILVLIMVWRPEGLLGQNELSPRFFRSIFMRKKPVPAEERG